jgi:uncharacterized protein (DUF1800 family)
MTLIWHGLLTSQASVVGGRRFPLMVRQNELLRAHALARYDQLLQAISKDPAMMVYLDTVTSTREHPNENYARELMELFSMGVGNYTEEDVREAARAFTGWRFTQPPRTGDEPDFSAFQPAFILNARQHDAGAKKFLGRSGNFGGEDIVAIILEQPATGRYISRRLFVELANYNPDDATIDSLVGVWEASGHDVKAIVRAILTSDEFYSQRSYRGFVRSPIDFVVGAVRGLEIETDFAGLVGGQGRNTRAAGLRQMDQVLFEPPNVAGWPGGASWLSSSTFYARVNFLDQLLFPRGSPIAIPALRDAATAEEAVDTALQRLVDGNVPAESREALYAFARSVTRPADRAAAIAYLVLASPEYQLT